jgi:indole-3-glycerol phosphate synthase
MLDQIIQTKRDRINILKEHYIINDHLDSKPTKFFQTLLESSNVYKIIGEIKKASPSAGLIKEDFDLLGTANNYVSSGIGNLSVLTEEDYFLGQYEYISQIKETLDIKILQKDFIIDEWQIYHAKNIGADCILLISEALTKVEINLFIKIAKEQGLDVLLEFHNEDEITKIVDVELDVIGINNRNLHTLKTDINHCLHIRDKYSDQLSRFNIVAESGFSKKSELEMYKTNGIDLFLIGESLLKGKL